MKNTIFRKVLKILIITLIALVALIALIYSPAFTSFQSKSNGQKLLHAEHVPPEGTTINWLY
jgi:hypothetical protein